jgi:hypothetical protein
LSKLRNTKIRCEDDPELDDVSGRPSSPQEPFEHGAILIAVCKAIDILHEE